MVRRSLMVCLAFATGALWVVPIATAAQCGDSGGEGKGETLTGSLLLRSADSTTTLSFERDKDARRLIMEFDVDGCDLPATAPIQAIPRSSDLDDESVFGEAKIEPEGNSLYVALPVDPDHFDPGQHSASITVRSPLLTPTRAKVTVQRTEPAFKPTALAILAVILGVIGAIVVSASLAGDGAGKNWFPGWVRLGAVVVAALFAAGAVWWSSYGDAEVWEWELDTWGPLFIGALTAAYGAATGALQAKKSSTGK
jgi:hypothetical protein